MKTSMGVSHKSTLLFFVQWCCWSVLVKVRATTRIASFFSSLAVSPGSMSTPPLLSTQSEFCTTLRTNEKWLPSSFPVFPRAHGRPFTHDARPIVANMLPPPSPWPPMRMGAAQGWAPFPGRHRSTGRPGSSLAAVSSPPPGVWLSDLVCSTFPKSVQSFQGGPFHVHRPGLLLFCPFPRPKSAHRPSPLLSCFCCFSSASSEFESTKLESLGCASLSFFFFREHSSNKSCPIFHFVRSFYTPSTNNGDRQPQLDRRQTVDTTSSTSTKLLFQHPTHTHARFVLIFARLLRRTPSPTPDDTHPRVANLLPSSDPASVDGPPQHRTPTPPQCPKSPTPELVLVFASRHPIFPLAFAKKSAR